MRIKHCLFVLSIVLFISISAIASAEEYNPPFQISGIVKNVTEDSLEVYLPYINKQVTVVVLPETKIVSRIDENAAQSLKAIAIEDLVVIKGVLQGESFCSKDISYLPSSK